jgi:hypothetical protein
MESTEHQLRRVQKRLLSNLCEVCLMMDAQPTIWVRFKGENWELVDPISAYRIYVVRRDQFWDLCEI